MKLKPGMLFESELVEEALEDFRTGIEDYIAHYTMRMFNIAIDDLKEELCRLDVSSDYVRKCEDE